jgi:membrane protease subunit (stomatin/prohibitin family)
MIENISSSLVPKFLRLISCPDMGPNSLTYRFDDGDKAIERGARLLVSEGQVAQFVYLGKYGDLFGPGDYKLQTDNIPLLTALASWRYGFESPFKADIYFVATKLFTGCKWGTLHPVMVQDPKMGVVRLRAYGSYDFRIVNVPLFLTNVAGTDHNFTLSEFEETMKTRVASSFAQAMALSGLEAGAIASRHHELGAAFLPAFNKTIVDQYGVELTSLVVESVSLPPEVEQLLDATSGVRALGGDLQTYLQLQLARAMGNGGAGALSAPAELALGLTASRMVGTPGTISPASPLLPPVSPQHSLSVGSSPALHGPSKEAYSLEEASQSFGVPIEALEKAIEGGNLISYDLLGKRVVKVSDLHALMQPSV